MLGHLHRRREAAAPALPPGEGGGGEPGKGGKMGEKRGKGGGGCCSQRKKEHHNSALAMCQCRGPSLCLWHGSAQPPLPLLGTSRLQEPQDSPGLSRIQTETPPSLLCRFLGWDPGKNSFFCSCNQAGLSKAQEFCPGSAPRVSLLSDTWVWIQINPREYNLTISLTISSTISLEL